MVSQRIEQQLRLQLASLSEQQQERVLEYARSLAAERSRGMTGAELAKLRGIIPPENARKIGEIIDRDCGQVDPNGW
jgi:hypothetical protein